MTLLVQNTINDFLLDSNERILITSSVDNILLPLWRKRIEIGAETGDAHAKIFMVLRALPGIEKRLTIHDRNAKMLSTHIEEGIHHGHKAGRLDLA